MSPTIRRTSTRFIFENDGKGLHLCDYDEKEIVYYVNREYVRIHDCGHLCIGYRSNCCQCTEDPAVCRICRIRGKNEPFQEN